MTRRTRARNGVLGDRARRQHDSPCIIPIHNTEKSAAGAAAVVTRCKVTAVYLSISLMGRSEARRARSLERRSSALRN